MTDKDFVDIVTRLRKFARDFSFTDTHSDFSLTEAADEIERLRAERDEARREVCYLRPTVCLGAQSADGYAMARGWDCFKEGT